MDPTDFSLMIIDQSVLGTESITSIIEKNGETDYILVLNPNIMDKNLLTLQPETYPYMKWLYGDKYCIVKHNHTIQHQDDEEQYIYIETPQSELVSISSKKALKLSIYGLIILYIDLDEYEEENSISQVLEELNSKMSVTQLKHHILCVKSNRLEEINLSKLNKWKKMEIRKSYALREPQLQFNLFLNREYYQNGVKDRIVPNKDTSANDIINNDKNSGIIVTLPSLNRNFLKRCYARELIKKTRF
jgi:hypothetical protein